MPNEYSVQFHDFITAKIDKAGQRLAAAEQSYWQGQLEELAWLRTYLKAHVDLQNFVYYQ